MANRPITIEGIGADGRLNLSDHGITHVDPGDSVTWIIGPNSGISAITGITNSGPTDVFAPKDPAPLAGSSNWQGTVNPKVPRGSEENYLIHFIKEEGNEPGSFDPKIQVNS